MKKIEMVDLKGQYKEIEQEIRKSLNQVLHSTQFIKGPDVSEFERDLEKYLGVNNAIACGSGTDALQIALMSLELNPGEEIITTDFTFAATIEVILLLGLKPILVDIDPKTFNIDPNKVKEALTKKTKAIIPVHLFGQISNMDEILNIAKENKLFIIEDNAQSMGSTYTFLNGEKKKAGTIGDIGTTSFFPSKNLGAYGDGGAIFTDNNEFADRIRAISNHGMYKRYYHDLLGVNSRLDSLQAAILKVKLKYLDSYNQKRQNAANEYNNALKNHENIITPFHNISRSSHVYHQYTIRVTNSDRDKLAEHLSGDNIPYGIYYPLPLHKQKAYHNDSYIEDNFKVTNKMVNEVISLPMHSELDENQIDYISSSIKSFFKNK
ncbi:MAG: transcriptional regulator [Flavobacteriaceae bacterium]|nr:transcriptional regulator [Flavobacteriaceae bacterium]|tara:strand:- start:106 stop:1242 length:1137 start_codon:yes stop_codon:yes gene_type:complete